MQDTELECLIQIFTVSGKLVKTIDVLLFSTGFKSEGIEWDGLDDYGSKIGKGVYIYRVKLRTPNGKTVEKFEKLLILK
jgi:flagellar hook assembly protein FlgD